MYDGTLLISIPIPPKDKNPVPSVCWLGWNGEEKDRTESTILLIFCLSLLSWKVGPHPQYLQLMAGSLCSICQTPEPQCYHSPALSITFLLTLLCPPRAVVLNSHVHQDLLEGL